jgi:hypothetical protein
MRSKIAIALTLGWLLGITSGMLIASFAGNEYYSLLGCHGGGVWTPQGDCLNYTSFARSMTQNGWEPFRVGNELYYRRPRIRWP